MAGSIFFDISILMGITVLIAIVMRALRQPPIVAYIFSGMLAGPLFLGIITERSQFFNTLAELGVVLLLFIIGLSLNFTHIKQLGKTVFWAGLLQFAVTATAGFFILRSMSVAIATSAFIGVACAFSSTIIVAKLLNEKKDNDALYGRFTIGVLLLQDIIAIIILIFLNTLTVPQLNFYGTILAMLFKGLGLVAGVSLISRYFLPKLLRKIASSGELLFIFTIAWCFGVAALAEVIGFNLEIGSIIAGVALGTSPFQPEISSRIRPLRDFFIVLFFVVLGSQMQLGDLRSVVWPALLISLFVMVVDPLILYLVMRLFKYTRRNSFLIAITAAQVSEFGFILLFKGQEIGLVNNQALTMLTIVAMVTIIISTYLISFNNEAYARLRPILELFGADKYQQKEENPRAYDAWVFGYHRIGWKICETLAKKNISFAVIDFNPDTIQGLKKRGVPAYFGDAADVEFLESLPLQKARLVISTMPEADDQRTLATRARQMNKNVKIILNSYHASDMNMLYRAGADYVMMPHLLGGEWISEILLQKDLTETALGALRKKQGEDLVARVVSSVEG
jgi:Kef-type K+ transport system membrane component KefB/voltage-gated potassium channel Kch